jgi:hypothetical protein
VRRTLAKDEDFPQLGWSGGKELTYA